jgi:DNA-binding CsgD family transcriptional regulator
LSFAEAELASAYVALHEVACGVVVLGRDKRVVFVNRAAESLCADGRGLLLLRQSQGALTLRAVRTHEDAAVQRAIDAALRIFALNTCDRPRSVPVVVHGAALTDPLLSTTLPLPPNMRGTAHERARAIVLIEDPAEKRPAAERLFAAVFGFTPAECRVAEALMSGYSPKAIAERFAVSENTVRTQIKSLCTKTDTRGMANLIAMLSRFAATRASSAIR